ncbi:sugar MFS transporter [Parapedobacter lycopersici]|uniref:sugar MFS transporter n=1 Tax=Parapedobacter lycopersici TaxID=1864939 RepID=UPI00214DC87C|nr:sugar MFS transporter [Parapedobacter lycopersici]
MNTLPSTASSTKGPMIIIGILFFIFGFVTWLNGPLITFVKLAFNLDTYAKAFMVTTAFYMAYFFLALPSSWILERTGMKKGMALGLFVMAVGTFVFGTYATQRNYNVSLAGLFIIGSGLSLLQTASNPYISILGPIESAARRISIMGICNKSAGILSPIIISALVFSGVGDLERLVQEAASHGAREALLNEFAAKIYVPYMVMAVVLVLLSIWVAKSALPDIDASAANSEPVGDSALSKQKTSIFQFPHLLLGALCIFLYVGAEVIAGDAIGAYAQGFNIPAAKTTIYTSFTLGAMLVGYIIGLFTIPKIITQGQALKISAILGIIFTIGAYLTTGYVSVAFVALLGLANALMWPAIWPLAISGLGRFTEKGSALMIMGLAGGAIIPQLFASLKDKFDFQLVFLILMGLCYLYILYYSRSGHKVGKPRG